MAFLRHTWDLLLRLLLAAGAFLQAQWADLSLRLLVTLMLLDFASGVLAAFLRRSGKTQTGGLSSVAGLRGIARKALILLIVAAAGVMDTLLETGAPMLRHAVTVFYAANEVLSLVENLALSGLPVPPKLRNALDVLKRDAS